MTLEVLDPGFLTTLQDLGRPGYGRYGVPVSGAMDFFAFRAANRLVGNRENAPGLEFFMTGPVLQTWDDCLLSLTGVGFTLRVQPPNFQNGSILWNLPAWTAVILPKGSIVHVDTQSEGGWGYLAFAGGLVCPLVLGSCSTYLRGGFGGLDGRRLEAGDILPVEELSRSLYSLGGRWLPPEARPSYQPDPVIEVVLGPKQNRFTPEGMEAFLSTGYRVTGESDRMGYRLSGVRIQHKDRADLLSEGMALGSIQVPASGQPIVAMSDHQTIGGYNKVATTCLASMPLLAQCPLEIGRLRFKEVDVSTAQLHYRMLLENLNEIVERE